MAEYIDRKALLDRMNDYCVRNCPDTTYCISCFMTDAKEIVDSQDAEDVRPVVHGKWVWKDYCFQCSVCSHNLHAEPRAIAEGYYNFCPNCGTDMREAEDG